MNLIKIKQIGLLRYIDDKLSNRLSYIHYLICKIINKPYFGSYLASVQGQRIRHAYMQKLIYEKFKDYDGEIKLLEIGSWAGGSVFTWIDIFESMEKKYKIYCIDPWEDYISDQGDLWTHKTMKKALKKNKIYKLFLHNILSSGFSQNVSILRGSTEEMTKVLKKDSFDIVFIDGNHAYDFVRKDLELTSTLVKNNGILSGDDLELQYNEIDKKQLENNKNKDVINDNINFKNYHPGVTLAIMDFFKKSISSIEGFWFVSKKDINWENIELKDKNILGIPKHLKGEL
jgi:hypothetical protein